MVVLINRIFVIVPQLALKRSINDLCTVKQIWAVLCKSAVIGLYFFEENGHIGMVTSECYITMIREFFFLTNVATKFFLG